MTVPDAHVLWLQVRGFACLKPETVFAEPVATCVTHVEDLWIGRVHLTTAGITYVAETVPYGAWA
jgi:hypothetical protein